MDVVAVQFFVEDNDGDVGNGAEVNEIKVGWWVPNGECGAEEVVETANSEQDEEDDEE